MSLWDDVHYVNEFLCIELKEGCVIIAIIGIVYGLIGFLLVLSFMINYEEWKTLYDKKIDELVFFMSLFIIISMLLLISIILLIGVLTSHEILIRLYLWSVTAHLCLDWIVTVSMCVYCVCVHSCFRHNPAGMVVGSVMLAAFYTLVWGYFIIVVNSYRMDI